MLRSVKALERYKVGASDGDTGKISDFYFDDVRWTIRYLVADTSGFWEGPHRVLVSPISFREVDSEANAFRLSLPIDKLKHAPRADLDKPVSRQHEANFNRYYGWAPYWGQAGCMSWGLASGPSPVPGWDEARDGVQAEASDSHLRSIKEVTHYEVHGSDGHIGRIDDFLVDDETWDIRYVVVDTSPWWVGKHVLVSPSWVTRVSWTDRKLFFDLMRAAIESSPEYVPGHAIGRSEEIRLHSHHHRPGYWVPSENDRSAAMVEGDIEAADRAVADAARTGRIV